MSLANRKSLKFLFIIIILFFMSFISCKTSEKVIKTYSFYPSKDQIDEIFNSKDYEAIMKYYINFQNNEDSIFVEKLQDKMKKLLSEDLNSSLNEKLSIQQICKSLNNYFLFNYFIFEKKTNQEELKYQFNDILINRTLEYIIDRINEIDNYYLFSSYLSYIETIFPYFSEKLQSLKLKKFDEKSFISSYEDVYKNTAMIIMDKGIKIENGQSLPDISLGTGFFIDYNKIITNYHVVNGEGKKYILSVKLNSSTFSANLILFDESLDLAILEIPYNNKDFKYFRLSNSINIGDEVIASGNPYGLSFTNSKGIVSNLDRRFLEIGKVIQIDAPINPGNSGGPVFKPSFELIGIAFASILNSQNLNFILPISFFLNILTNLNINTEVIRSWLGFYFYDNNLLYQVKGTQNYQFIKNNSGNIEDIRFLYPVKQKIDEKDYFLIIQNYISYLPNSSFIPVFIKGKYMFLLTERRPKYPMNFAISNDEINNCLTMIFDAKFSKESEFFKIEKLFNPEISLFYGIYQGDLMKVLSYIVQAQKKMIILYILIKHPRYGGAQQQIAISIGFSQPGFF